jgi:pimeloyl-ACP methyl ester carboxylesterase
MEKGMETANINGVDLAYVRRGQGTPLVLIHGYPLDHSIWDPILPLLEDTFTLIVPDLRGFGASSGVEGSYGMNDYAADLAGLLDHLGIDQAAMVGHSMGGYVAQAFARAYPARVRGLGLVSTQAPADPPDRKEGRYKTAAEVEEKGVGGVAEGMAPKLSSDPALQGFAKDLMGRQSVPGVAGALKAMAERQDATEVLKGFQMPLVIIHGEADELIPVDRAREVESAVMQARLFVLPGIGHLPMMQAPEETAEALKHLA